MHIEKKIKDVSKKISDLQNMMGHIVKLIKT